MDVDGQVRPRRGGWAPATPKMASQAPCGASGPPSSRVEMIRPSSFMFSSTTFFLVLFQG